MTTILITQPAVPVTAEQVVAYLLRTGWECIGDASDEWDQYMSPVGRRFTGWPRDAADSPHYMQTAIEDIARAESRPALDVLADILGPVAGTVGVGCEPASVRPRPIAKLRCFWRLQREREGVEDAKRKARVAPFYHEGEAPSAPKE